MQIADSFFMAYGTIGAHINYQCIGNEPTRYKVDANMQITRLSW